jgi:hypothetical protein
MSLYIADRKYDGTLERAVALVLDHYVIFSGRYKGTGRDTFILLHDKAGWDGVAAAIVKAVEAHYDENFVVRPNSLEEIGKDINTNSLGKLLSMAARQMP